MGAVNWRGFYELYAREVRRFMKIYQQTLAAPVVTTLIFLAIFALAIGGAGRVAGNVPFLEFLAPGLIMMSMVQNAFANTSSSIMISKIQGNIVDILMPPLSPLELTLAYTLSGITRGLVVGVTVLVAMLPFVDIKVHDIGFILFHGFGACAILSILGVLTGVWSEKFDHLAAVTNFIITPLSFLSGTFYSVDRLPDEFEFIAHLNPFFYMIDGFRYGFIGHEDALANIGLAVVTISAIGLFIAAYLMFRRGYRLKA